jgi:hypothetical protein
MSHKRAVQFCCRVGISGLLQRHPQIPKHFGMNIFLCFSPSVPTAGGFFSSHVFGRNTELICWSDVPENPTPELSTAWG